MSDILYFEALDIPLPQLQQLKPLTISWHGVKTEEVAVLNVRLPKQSTVADVLEDLRSKVNRPIATLYGISDFRSMQ